MGNFLGDFVRGKQIERLPAGVQRGVQMHRAIDRLTDTDEDVRRLNQTIARRHGRYAGVLTDIAFDHYLWRNWDTFGPEPFGDFTQTAYANLYARRAYMTDRVRGYVNGMVKDDWLRLYTTRPGMQRVFDRLRPRLSRPELLTGVEDLLQDHDQAFNRTFRLLFPRLEQLAHAYRPDTPTSP